MANPTPVNPSPESEETIFAAAVLLTSSAARAAYLDQACAGRPELRRGVEELLGASDAAGTLLDHSPVAPVPAAFLRTPAGVPAVPPLSLPADEGPGTQIGRYKLLEKIGEGGFGEVYVAEQREPVKRKVALKIIKLGMDTRQVIARFEAERQALAMMDHPNIAKVLDAGATDTGRPYFVMELVRGHSITRYSDDNQLTAVERLKLFVLVCHAIQHAHQKGIIHRDIKPSNILVTLHDGVPVPKVIDFGIAKATQGELTDKTIHTQFQSFIGTPAYVSPEQVEMSGLDIDTRSDIYALGVLLYELLVGRTPFDGRELLQAGLDSMRRTIRETEPVRPSTRLSTLQGIERTSVAQRRGGADVAKLAGALRGDVDWIVMKCLEKDRTRRYETANGLAADITRHLTNEPVVARPPSAAYKLHKAWRRNRVLFTAGTAVVLALVVGVIGITAGLVRANRQRQAAQVAQKEESRQREIAFKALDGERQQTARADAAREGSEAAAYCSAINLAQKAVADQNFGLAWDLLNGQRPGSGRQDRRGWEWRYLWQQCQSDAMSSPLVLSNRYMNLSVSRDGKLLVATINGVSALLEIPGPHQLRVIDPFVACNEIYKAAFSPDGGLLAINPANDGHILRLLDTRTWKTVGETSLAESPRGLFFSSDGKTLLSVLPYANETEQVALWQVPTLERIANSHGFRVRSGDPRDRAAEQIIEIAAPADLSAIAVLARGGSPTKVRVVDTATGKDLWHVYGPAFTGQQFSPDGRLLLVSEGMAVEPKVRIFDARSGQELGLGLTEHREWVSSLVFWPDGKTLATASADQTIRLWDMSDPARPKPIGRPLQGHKAEVWGLALLPDQRTLVSTDKEGTFLTWDTQQARIDRPRLTLSSTNGWDAYRFGPDGKTIFAVDGKGAVLRLSGRDFEVRDEVANLGEEFTYPVFSPDCRWLACGSTNGLVQLWDLGRRTRVKEFPAGTGRVKPFQFRGGGKSLIVVSDDPPRACEWNLASFKELGSWQDIIGPSLLSPDERWFFTFADREGINSFLSRDMVTGLRTVQTNTQSKVEHVTDLTISPDGTLLVASSEKGYARILDRATLRPVGTLSGFLVQAVFSSCFSPDGKRLATSSGGREALRLWDVDRRQLLVGLEASQRTLFWKSQFSPDANILGAVSVSDGSLHLWRAPSWEEIAAAEAKGPPSSGFDGGRKLDSNPQ